MKNLILLEKNLSNLGEYALQVEHNCRTFKCSATYYPKGNNDVIIKVKKHMGTMQY